MKKATITRERYEEIAKRNMRLISNALTSSKEIEEYLEENDEIAIELVMAIYINSIKDVIDEIAKEKKEAEKEFKEGLINEKEYARKLAKLYVEEFELENLILADVEEYEFKEFMRLQNVIMSYEMIAEDKEHLDILVRNLFKGVK